MGEIIRKGDGRDEAGKTNRLNGSRSKTTLFSNLIINGHQSTRILKRKLVKNRISKGVRTKRKIPKPLLRNRLRASWSKMMTSSLIPKFLKGLYYHSLSL